MNGTTRGARIVVGVAVTKSAKGVVNGTERKKMMIDKYNEAGIEIESDGFITRAETLERINANKAKPTEECAYPNCETCGRYRGRYCTVPIVFSKQMLRHTEERLENLQYRLTKLEDLVFDELLKPKRPTRNAEEKANFTWADYFDKEQE